MGKRIVSQARGKGSSTYRVKKKAFIYKLRYPRNLEGEGTVLKILNSSAHSCPLAKINCSQGVFYIPAFHNMVEGQKLKFTGSIENGSFLKLKEIPIKTRIYNIESRPGDGGKFIKTAGTFGTINKVIEKKVFVIMPSKKEKGFNEDCRAIIGVVAGSGRLDKPVIKAGKKYWIKKSKGKLWPRTSAVKMNVIDHPFGSGRGKNPKSKIAKRNAPPGRRVGLLRPRRTGKRK
jgi:large subunit ribosomal protein L2